MNRRQFLVNTAAVGAALSVPGVMATPAEPGTLQIYAGVQGDTLRKLATVTKVWMDERLVWTATAISTPVDARTHSETLILNGKGLSPSVGKAYWLDFLS